MDGRVGELATVGRVQIKPTYSTNEKKKVMVMKRERETERERD